MLASIAALITAPAAILIARYFRSRAWWFKAHLILQALTVAFIVIAFVLSTVAVSSGGHGTQFTGPKKDPKDDFDGFRDPVKMNLSGLLVFLS